MATRVYCISDVHIDYKGNFQHLLTIDDEAYKDSCLLVAGDVTDDLHKLEVLLTRFSEIFEQVFFVPGNHELWIRGKKNLDSVEKFLAIRRLCARIGVATSPRKVGGEQGVWIVPLFSWYTKADEGDDTLYRPKPGDDQTEAIWADNHRCDWSSLPPGMRVADYFLDLNETHIHRNYDAPVISFSHFLPLQELAFPVNYLNNPPRHFFDPMPQFNFTRVAGTTKLAEQIERLGSTIHVFGHQHRNRHRTINGTTYVSHCLGYPRERQTPFWRGHDTPKLLWHDGKIDVDIEF